MNILQTLFAVVMASAMISLVNSAECYEICGWSSTDYGGAQAILKTADCTWTPSGRAWLPVKIYYSGQPNSDLFLRIKTSDSRVDLPNGVFKPLLLFHGYDGTSGLPIVKTDILLYPHPPDPNMIKLLYSPPEQADILSLLQTAPNIQVRLRHRDSGNCLTTSDTNGEIVTNEECICAYNSDQLFKLVSAGGGTYRLQHVNHNQCLYALDSNGARVHHWGCWNDLNMRFKIIPSQGGYRLQHVNHNQCIYGNQQSGGQICSWGCWDDPNMVFYIDVVVRPFSITELICSENTVENDNKQHPGLVRIQG